MPTQTHRYLQEIVESHANGNIKWAMAMAEIKALSREQQAEIVSIWHQYNGPKQALKLAKKIIRGDYQ